MLGVAQPLPMLLSLMRAYERKEIKLALLKRAVRAIEDFHFAFTAVASQPSSGGISSMYALHGRQLAAADDPSARAAEIAALIDKLREKRPSREVFIAGFQDLRASELYSQQKRLATYILRRFHAERVGPPADPDVMTVEHIANEGKAPDPDLVAMMGNLLYVDLELNGDLGNKSFSAKKEILDAASGVWVGDFVLGGDGWDREEIEERTIELAGRPTMSSGTSDEGGRQRVHLGRSSPHRHSGGRSRDRPALTGAPSFQRGRRRPRNRDPRRSGASLASGRGLERAVARRERRRLGSVEQSWACP